MESFIHLSVKPSHVPILPISHDISSYKNCFYIDFYYSNTILFLGFDFLNSTNNPTSIYIERLFIPVEILCNCREMNHNIAIYNHFDSVPTYILDAILPGLEECARKMVVENDEGRDTLEMKLWLHVTTTLRPIEEEEDEDDRNQNDNGQIQQIVDSLEILEIDHSSFDSIEECSICLEKFCDSLKSEIVNTKCSHFFHKDCIVSWIKRCINRSSNYSCPLCRGQII
ncbi:uncharacterized protein [Cicer arietinum]|uniref:Uncharacterized protein LOC101511314 n=1 Tax=Cicer arietinum TaxID=3827 RepID=A0A1S2Z5J0_CICAR|nr:uncharacterized protein LOC101511314 [Cicer arietinum]